MELFSLLKMDRRWFDLSMEHFFADRGARREPQDVKSKKVSLFPRSL